MAFTEQKGRRKTIVTPGLLHPQQGKVALARLVSILPTLLGFGQVQVRIEPHLSVLVTFLLYLGVPTVSCFQSLGHETTPTLLNPLGACFLLP